MTSYLFSENELFNQIGAQVESNYSEIIGSKFITDSIYRQLGGFAISNKYNIKLKMHKIK